MKFRKLSNMQSRLAPSQMNHYLITLKNPPIFEFPAPNLKTKTLFTNNSTSFSLSKQLHTQQVKINRKKSLSVLPPHSQWPKPSKSVKSNGKINHQIKSNH